MSRRLKNLDQKSGLAVSTQGVGWLSLRFVLKGLVCLLILLGVGYGYFQLSWVGSLNSLYPLVWYRGPNLPPRVELVERRPKGWVNLSSISVDAVAAIVVSEDWAFYNHKGFDMNQIHEAFKTDLKEGRFHRGASTITQQVAKNVFLSQSKSLSRKLLEVVFAVRLEQTLTKKKILEIYLNIAEWGKGIYGIGPASQYYFHKIPAELSAKEGAFLAMLLPSPKRYGQSFHKRHLTEFAQDTVDSILEKMVQAGYLTQEEMVSQKSVPLGFELQ